MKSTRQQLIQRLREKSRRDNFINNVLGTTLSAQVFGMRKSRDWSQTELAKRAGTGWRQIALLEDTDDERYSLATLKKVACAFDVALMVKFVSYSELIDWHLGFSESDLSVLSFDLDDGLLRSAQRDELPPQRTENQIGPQRSGGITIVPREAISLQSSRTSPFGRG